MKSKKLIVLSVLTILAFIFVSDAGESKREPVKEINAKLLVFPQGCVSSMFPVGFSKDGKYAFVTARDVAYGKPAKGSKLSLVIFDLKNDTVLSETQLTGKEATFKSSNEEIAIASGGKAGELLGKYKIIAGAQSTLVPFPANIDGNIYDVKIERSLQKLDDGKGPAKHDVILISNKHGTKTVASLNTMQGAAEGSFVYEYPQKVIGYLRSPLEPRIIIFLRSSAEMDGKDGCSSNPYMGAHLLEEFAK